MRHVTSAAVAVAIAFWLSGCATIDAAHDAARVDPARYTVEFENERVRVLRIKYGPYARSIMHQHPDSVLVFMTEGRAKFAFPDGSMEEISWEAGEARWAPAVRHLPENTTGSAIEIIQIELK